MSFSFGGGRQRASAAAVTGVLLLGVGACSGSDAEPLAEASSQPTATVDPVAKDQADVTALVNRFWAIIVQGQNSADTDRGQFRGVAEGTFIENEFRKLDGYADQGIKRIGQPTVSSIDVVVDGDTAQVAHCIDEDAWTAEKNGEPLDPILSGNRPFGLTASRTADGWIITDTGLTTAQEKAKDCP